MNTDSVKNSHCSYCGTRFTEQKLWPRKCFRCYNDSFSNPLPVVVVMQVVDNFGQGNRKGIIIQQRGIEPKKGGWALTGGYIDDGETWEEAGVREVYEEMGLEIKQNSLELYDVTSSTNKNNILICCVSRAPYDWNGYDDPGLKDFFERSKQFPNHEVEAVDIMWEERELAFPAHTEWANKFLKELNKGK